MSARRERYHRATKPASATAATLPSRHIPRPSGGALHTQREQQPGPRSNPPVSATERLTLKRILHYLHENYRFPIYKRPERSVTSPTSAREIEYEKKYIQRLKLLLNLNPARVEKALEELSAVATEQAWDNEIVASTRGRWRVRSGGRKKNSDCLVFEFEKILDAHLIEVGEQRVQLGMGLGNEGDSGEQTEEDDRDVSLLDVVGELGHCNFREDKRNRKKKEVETEDGEYGYVEYGYDGRFDDIDDIDVGGAAFSGDSSWHNLVNANLDSESDNAGHTYYPKLPPSLETTKHRVPQIRKQPPPTSSTTHPNVKDASMETLQRSLALEDLSSDTPTQEKFNLRPSPQRSNVSVRKPSRRRPLGVSHEELDETPADEDSVGVNIIDMLYSSPPTSPIHARKTSGRGTSNASRVETHSQVLSPARESEIERRTSYFRSSSDRRGIVQPINPPQTPTNDSTPKRRQAESHIRRSGKRPPKEGFGLQPEVCTNRSFGSSSIDSTTSSFNATNAFSLGNESSLWAANASFEPGFVDETRKSTTITDGESGFGGSLSGEVSIEEPNPSPRRKQSFRAEPPRRQKNTQPTTDIKGKRSRELASEGEDKESLQSLAAFFEDADEDEDIQQAIQDAHMIDETDTFALNDIVTPEEEEAMREAEVKSEDEGLRFNPAAHPLDTLPFHVQYEATRIALNCGCSPSNESISTALNGICDRLYESTYYEELWDKLKEFSGNVPMPEPTNATVWRALQGPEGWTDDLSITGNMQFDSMFNQSSGSSSTSSTRNSQVISKGETIPFTVRLNPLTKTKGTRFFNRFGSDRFMILRFPTINKELPSALRNFSKEEIRVQLIDWLVYGDVRILNRRWKCFWVKDGKSVKRKSDKDRSTVAETFLQGYFFATEGVGISEKGGNHDGKLGFAELEKKLRGKMEIDELLQWHVPFDNTVNLEMSVAKMWSRISLGFSSAKPTHTFEPNQIKFVGDKLSPTNEVMDDGCSVISPGAMRRVREKLGLEETPSAVQGRIGGAKGVWMIDPSADFRSDDVYIHVSKSQLKYQRHDSELEDPDWARLTLDVLAYPKEPVPTHTNIQLIPILEHGGVKYEVFEELLKEHLEGTMDEAIKAMDDPVALRSWVYDRGGNLASRLSTGEIAWQGGLPVSKHEAVILLLENGFRVNECWWLKRKILDIMAQFCDDLKAKLHIKIPRSTTILCIADPTGTLEENEVSLRFSRGFVDAKTKTRISCYVGDVLVSRNPAHLPSDIQKVKAVSNDALRYYQDVIVFSTKGDRSLASLLSGGDYDGDKAWVCWDERLVEQFQNTDIDSFRELDEDRWFEKTSTKMRDLRPGSKTFFTDFIRMGIENSMAESFLGICTTIKENYCYKNRTISDSRAIMLSQLCSYLVDAPKQGKILRPWMKKAITSLELKAQGGPLPRPAYTQPGDWIAPERPTHTLDRLHFEVAKTIIMEKQQALAHDIDKVPRSDPDLTAIFHREERRAKEDPTGSISNSLMHLNQSLEKTREIWKRNQGGDSFGPILEEAYRDFLSIKPPEDCRNHPVVARWFEDDGLGSEWSRIRASAAFLRFKGVSSFVWYMAGDELCRIKAEATASRGIGGVRSLLPGMYISLKANNKFLGIGGFDEETE